MSNLGSRHLGFFPKGLAYDCGPKFPISSKFVYGRIWPGNDGWLYLRVKFKWSWPYMEISLLAAAILDIFAKGLTCDFGSKFQILSKCVYGQIEPGNDVWECFRVVTQWSWPYMKTLCIPSLGSSHHFGTMIGFLVSPHVVMRVLLWNLIVLSTTKAIQRVSSRHHHWLIVARIGYGTLDCSCWHSPRVGYLS